MKVEVKVKPNSGNRKIEKISENKYLVHLKSPPENNKANIELIKLMKKELNKDFGIISGVSSRKKILGEKNAN